MEIPGWAWLVVLLIVVEAVVLIGFFRKQAARRAAAEAQVVQVQRTGDPATARVLETIDTGRRLGEVAYLIVKLRLAVQPASGEPFETLIEARISPVRIGDFSEGREIAVRVDPQTRAVAVDQRVD